MRDSTLDRAVQAAAEAISEYPDSDIACFEAEMTPRELAGLAVKAAAPHLADMHEEWLLARQRAERAEAEVERLRTLVASDWENEAKAFAKERALADLLAEALRPFGDHDLWRPAIAAALAAYDEARRD